MTCGKRTKRVKTACLTAEMQNRKAQQKTGRETSVWKEKLTSARPVFLHSPNPEKDNFKGRCCRGENIFKVFHGSSPMAETQILHVLALCKSHNLYGFV